MTNNYEFKIINSENNISTIYISLCELRLNLLNLGDVNNTIKTTSNVIIPPKTTEGTTPISFAARPDSNAPISLEEPMKMLLTAETLPFILSGVII